MGCSYLPPKVPPNVVVSARVPDTWRPISGKPLADPTIVGVRFSTLAPRLGTTWTGDIITSSEVDEVQLHTNLYDIEATRTSRGRFRFTQDLIDLPSFLVRPYRLSLIARAPDGRSTTLLVPIRIGADATR